MKRNLIPGIGVIAFAVLTVVAFAIANPPGGNYKAHDVDKYLARGHHTAVFVGLYFGFLATVGLTAFLAALGPTIGDGRLRRMFWAFGAAAIAAWAIGWCVVAAPPVALAFGSNPTGLAPIVAFVILEAGFVIVFGAGGVMLGAALIALVVGSGALPTWLRWATLIGGIAAIASLAFFPSFLVLIWAVVIGVWLIMTPELTDRTASG